MDSSLENSFLNPELATKTLQANLKFVGSALISNAFAAADRLSSSQQMLSLRHLRDTQIWNVPILPGAVNIYVHLSAHRDWQVSGKLNKALRAVEYINKTRTVSPLSGMVYEGFDDYLKRRALDFVSIGRTAFYVPSRASAGDARYMQYLDPTYLAWEKTDNAPVKPNQKVWSYYNDQTARMRFDEVFLAHPLPIGGVDLFMSPLAYVMPTAMLAWLLKEHNTASLDGRKIRDILFVGSDQIQTAVTTAITTMVALHAGEDPSKVGIPVVAVNNASGLALKDQIHTLGLSNIPENFNSEKFTFDYVNQISSSLGLALRHFWNAEVTTNKALEEVQEQRQQQKGPAVFTRVEERLINKSPGFDQFGSGSSRPHFSFIEEVDSASQLVDAQVLKASAEALESISRVFQASLSLESYLSWMQSRRILPNDLELVQGVSEGASQNVAPNDPPVTDATPASNDSVPPSGAKSPQPSPQKPPTSKKSEDAPLDYDEVSVDSTGKVREKRFKIFSIPQSLQKAVSEQVQKDFKSTQFENSLETIQKETVDTLRNLLSTKSDEIHEFIKTDVIFSEQEMTKMIEAVLTRDDLTEGELGLAAYLVEKFHV